MPLGSGVVATRLNFAALQDVFDFESEGLRARRSSCDGLGVAKRRMQQTH